ncbi:MAG: hypothetical protein R3F31_18940 [Verrucomicrobiales bacterium]
MPVGIHPHDDCGLAVANALASIRSGATQVRARSTATESAPAIATSPV